MSISQHSQPNEAVSSAMGEVYELLQLMPNKVNKQNVLYCFPQTSVACMSEILFDASQMSTCAYLLLGTRIERHIDWHN